MSTFDNISRAREILDLPESATMEEIKSKYRNLLATWHPDRCTEDQDTCAEMTRQIIDAYQTIMKYCISYQYSFSEDSVNRNQSSRSPEEWWFERFQNDPLWGSGRWKK